MNSLYTQIQTVILILVCVCFANAYAGFPESQSEAVYNLTAQTVEEGKVSNSRAIHDGFLNGIGYGMSYPFVFWGVRKEPKKYRGAKCLAALRLEHLFR